MAVSKRLRYEILRRDKHTCRYCGSKAPDAVLTVDHVMPVSLGGSDEPNNLVAACKDCNAGKTSSSPDAPLVDDVNEVAARYALAHSRVVEERAAKFALDEENILWFNDCWNEWSDSGGRPLRRDDNWEASILRFLGAGLSRGFLARGVRIAMGNRKLRNGDKWRYFCGICHREIGSIAEEAARLAGSDEDSQTTSFPFMDMFDCFLDQLVPALGGNALVRKCVDRSLWDVMPVVNREFDEFQPGGVHEDAYEAAFACMSTRIAQDMDEIARLRKEGAGRGEE